MLWIAGLVSLTGDWLLGVALPIAVFQLTGSPAATSAVVAATVVAALLAGAVAGVFVDRWDRRRVLVVANLLQVVAVLPLLVVTSADRYWVVLVVAFVESALARFVAPAEHAVLPQLVGPTDLTAANSLSTLNRNLARLVGPALGAIVATALGLAGAAVLDALSFAVAAALVAMIAGARRATSTAPLVAVGGVALPDVDRAGAPLAPTDSIRAAQRGPSTSPGQSRTVVPAARRRLPRADRVSAIARWRSELAAGLVAIRGSRTLRALLLLIGVTSIGEGVMGSLFAVFAARGLAGGADDIGWLMSAQAVGGIAGGILAAVLAGRLRPVPTVVTGFALFGLIDVAIFNLPRFTPALAPQLVLFALVGIPGSMALAGAMTLLQTEVVDELRGRVFAAFGLLEAAASLVGALAAAGLTERLGVFTVLTAQGAGYLVAALAFAALVRSRRVGPRRGRGRIVLPGRDLATAGASRDAFQRRWNS